VEEEDPYNENYNGAFEDVNEDELMKQAIEESMRVYQEEEKKRQS
jgi:hypothetical protein